MINGTIKSLSKMSQTIYKELQKNPSISKPQIAKKLGISTASVSRTNDDLKNANLLLGKTANKGRK